MNRVVHVLTHLPFKADSVERFMLEGWQALMAREMARRSSKFAVESWLPAEVESPLSEERDGVLFRTFPARGEPFGYSSMMQEAAANLGHDAVLHIHGDRSMIAYALMMTKPRKFVQHHGSLGISVLTPVEAYTLRRAERIYCVSRQKMKYLRTIGISASTLQFRTMGVDFETFRPFDKAESRRRLGIDENAIVLFHPGRFDYQKGTDVVLNTYRALKKKSERLVLFMVGGSEADPLYAEAIRASKIIRGRVPHELMPYCYSAADVTCYFWRPPALWYGGGGSVSVLESLACNTPVVSNTLAHFRDLQGSEQFGALPQAEKDFPRAVEQVLGTRPSPRCREAARKHFSWDTIIQATTRDYQATRPS